jgi:hypothetical protein
MVKGFNVDADPVNPLGDGKSWVLVVEATNSLSKGTDPLDLARQCQRECVKGAAEPVWDGQTILVPLWDSGRVLKTSIAPRKAKTRRPKYRSKFRRAIYKSLLEYPEATTQTICAYVDEQCGGARTEKSWVFQYHKKTKQHESHLSVICQVKRAMGLT